MSGTSATSQATGPTLAMPRAPCASASAVRSRRGRGPRRPACTVPKRRSSTCSNGPVCSGRTARLRCRARDTIARPASTRSPHPRARDEGIDVLAFGRVPSSSASCTRSPRLGPTHRDPDDGDAGPLQYGEAAGSSKLPAGRAPGERGRARGCRADAERAVGAHPPRPRNRRRSVHSLNDHFRSPQADLHPTSTRLKELFGCLRAPGTYELGDRDGFGAPGSLVARPAGTSVAHALRAATSRFRARLRHPRARQRLLLPALGKFYLCGMA